MQWINMKRNQSVIMKTFFLNDPIWPVLFFNHSLLWFLVGPPGWYVDKNQILIVFLSHSKIINYVPEPWTWIYERSNLFP